MLWLWCRSAAIAPIRPLAWETPHAEGAALKRQKKKEKKKKKKKEHFYNYKSTFSHHLSSTPWVLSLFRLGWGGVAGKPSARSTEEIEEAGGQESKYLGEESKKVLLKDIVPPAPLYTTFMFIVWIFFLAF